MANGNGITLNKVNTALIVAILSAAVSVGVTGYKSQENKRHLERLENEVRLLSLDAASRQDMQPRLLRIEDKVDDISESVAEIRARMAP